MSAAGCAGDGGGQSNGSSQLAVDGLVPNPANGPIKLLWHIRRETRVSLKVYNTAGRVVSRLIDQTVKPGSYATVWNGTDARGRRLAGGIYFCSLETNDAKLNQKVVLTE